MKKIIFIVIGAIGGFLLMGLVLLIPILMVLDFFGSNSTDGHVEGNMEYARDFISVLNENIPNSNGYVSLERILFFYHADSRLTFSQIYSDNLDSDLRTMLPISEVCLLPRYRNLSVCSRDNIEDSNQLDDFRIKLFVPPVDFSRIRVTSFYKEERIVFGNFDIHTGWDFAGSSQTPLYAVCDGILTVVSFPYTQNISGSGWGNRIALECEIDGVVYEIIYAHLYPTNVGVSVGDRVNAGDHIAGIGTTGSSTGNHLHIELRINGVLSDILSLIDFTQ